jgi:ring-1,2-phenylacetyl-CoA epoxidase subunit PaaA
VDWAEFKRVIRGDGPCNAERIGNRRAAHESGAWVRAAAAAHAAKHASPATSDDKAPMPQNAQGGPDE